MTVRRIDQVKGDIFTSGVQFLDGLEEVAQTIVTRLHLYSGEYFRDITDGTPWFDDILGKGTTLSKRDAIIKRRIVETENVVKLISYNTTFDAPTRSYRITGEVETIFGETLFESEISTNGNN